MNTTGFIFDLDGVIVDTAKYHYQAWKKLAAQMGFEFTETHNELFKGVSRVRCLEILLEIGGMTVSKAQFDAWLIEKNEDYLKYIEKMDASEVLPGVVSVLKYLKAHNFPMALGSASKNAVPILEKVGLLEYFDAVVDGNHVTKAKPDPEVFLLAAEQLKVIPEHCIVFEDAVAGIGAANAAGMLSIGIGEAEVLKEADHNVTEFSAIDIPYVETLIATVSMGTSKK